MSLLPCPIILYNQCSMSNSLHSWCRHILWLNARAWTHDFILKGYVSTGQLPALMCLILSVWLILAQFILKEHNFVFEIFGKTSRSGKLLPSPKSDVLDNKNKAQHSTGHPALKTQPLVITLMPYFHLLPVPSISLHHNKASTALYNYYYSVGKKFLTAQSNSLLERMYLLRVLAYSSCSNCSWNNSLPYSNSTSLYICFACLFYGWRGYWVYSMHRLSVDSLSQ